MINKILITGANSGIGKESARLFAQNKDISKIYLGVRDLEKGKKAKHELELLTKRNIFELIQINLSNIDSTKEAALNLPEKIDALILNAGGLGGKSPFTVSENGVTDLAAQNVIGNVSFVDELLRLDKVNETVMFAGSEITRGVAKFGLARPVHTEYSEKEFKSVLNGDFFDSNFDPMIAYGHVKLIGTLWMSSMARKHKNIRFITTSPGATSGTEITNDASTMFKLLMKTSIGEKMGRILGLTHSLSTGAKRYLEVIQSDKYTSGRFYASKNPKGAIGKIVDQGKIDNVFYNEVYQDNAFNAIQSFMK